MDVMKPETIWIGTRCYRINQTLDATAVTKPERQQYIEQDDYSDGEEEDDYQIECNNGRYSTSFHVPSQFFAQIIGSKGATRRRIETETKTTITVPKQGQEGDIKITSNNRLNVATARRRIEIIVIGGRSKLAFTHFLSVPMIDETIQKAFQSFKEMLAADSSIYGINESYFQNPKKLHITVATLTLLDNSDRVNAAQCLQECKENIIQRVINEYGQLEVEMKGLEIMNDDPSAVSVLYGTVNCEALQQISDEIYDYFVAKGLTPKKFDRVKLHVTLINSLFGVEQNKTDDGQTERETFDAINVLQKYKDFYFGKVLIKEIHLSQRYSMGSNGYYEASSIVKL